ncbi:tyrosine-type recombinase/integrase [Bacteroidota bacterium]
MSKDLINLKLAEHDHKKVILLKFDYSDELKNAINKIPDCRWSNSKKSFYINYRSDYKHYLLRFVDEKYFKKLGKEIKTPSIEIAEKDKIEVQDNKSEIWLNKFKQYLENKRYSKSTIDNYVLHVKHMLNYFCGENPEELTNEDVDKYVHEFIIRGQRSASFQSVAISALKKFFGIVRNIYIDIEDFERPKKGRNLPSVFNQKEIKRLLDATTNIKHKLILSLIYSSGLRLGEAVNIKINDIDTRRKLICIRQAKGKKDRYSLLSLSIIPLLKIYYDTYKPKIWLIENKEGEQYSKSSIQKIFRKSKAKAKIRPFGGVHALRHSFATHLLDKGVDLRYIQELLGHKSSKTTEIYTHVTKRDIGRISSPLDSLDFEID